MDGRARLNEYRMMDDSVLLIAELNGSLPLPALVDKQLMLIENLIWPAEAEQHLCQWDYVINNLSILIGSW